MVMVNFVFSPTNKWNVMRIYKTALFLCFAMLTFALPIFADESEQVVPNAHFYHESFRVAGWIPDEEALPVIRGILFLGNGAGSDSRARVREPLLQEIARRHGFVLVGMQAGNFCDEDRWEQFEKPYLEMIEAAGRPELHHAPFLFWGHSNGGQQAYGMARRFPDRAIAFIVNKGRGQNKEAGVDPWDVPSLWIAGARDREVRRDNIRTLYHEGRANGAPWAWLEEYGQGHSTGNSQHLAFAFFEEVLPLRYPQDPDNIPTATSAPSLQPLDQSKGWLVDTTHEEWSSGYMGIRSQAEFSGDPLTKGWVPTERMAILFRATGSHVPIRALERNRRGKHIHITTPEATSEFNQLYRPGEAWTFAFELERSPAWKEIRIYDYDELIHTLPASEETSFEVDLKLDPSRPSHAIHAEMQLADGEKRTSLIVFVRAKTVAPAPE